MKPGQNPMHRGRRLSLFAVVGMLSLGALVRSVAAKEPENVETIRIQRAVPIARTPQTSPLGTWTTANGEGVVVIESCGNALCGRIVAVNRAPGMPVSRTAHGRSPCGVTIITAERPVADGIWLGEIIDPRDGATYRAKLWVDDRGDLHLRGFIGISLFGKTQIWHRFTGFLTAGCGIA